MRRAFTMVEMLVATAIIAIVAAIVFPAFARARAQARCAVCISNLRQIGTAVGAYLPDWDDRYPWACRQNDFGLTPYRPLLNEVLAAYVRDPRIWVCPSDIGETFPDGPVGYRHATPPFYTNSGSSYDYLGLHSPVPVLYYGMAGLSVSKLRSPVLLTLCGENRPWHGTYRKDDVYLDSPGLYNVLFCDGHIAQRTARQWFDDEYAGVK